MENLFQIITLDPDIVRSDFKHIFVHFHVKEIRYDSLFFLYMEKINIFVPLE